MKSYPKVTINLKELRENAKAVTEKCSKAGIDVAGVVKMAWGDPEVCRAIAASGVKQLASSRIKQLERAKAAGVTLPLMLIRIPMISEADSVVKTADISLQSDISVLRAFDEAAGRIGKKHKVVLMAELGDLREGIWSREELMDMALEVENKMPNLELAGVGTNLGCYGSILSTPEKMQDLVDISHAVEEKIGRSLEIVSGGGTRSYARVLDGNMPAGINHLRIGCQMLMAKELNEIWGHDNSDMNTEIFNLEAEIVELRDKPTHPFGEIGVDAFRNLPVYEDRGVRRRALLAVGKADYGQDTDCVMPRDKGVEYIGSSSDHTIVDIQDADREYKVGDILKFNLGYAAALSALASEDITVEYIDEQ